MTTHLMLDIESLGTRVGSIVTSVAFVRFSDEASCTLNLSIPDQEALGLEMDPKTLAWWEQQGAEAKAASRANPVALRNALAYFASWITWAGPDPLIWCHGATFDCPLLEELYRRAGLPTPWPYWGVRDTRTLYDLAGIDVKAFAVPPPHIALNDAIGQTRAAVAALKVLAKAHAT